MDRKTFIRKTSTGLLLGLPVLSMIGCSSSDDDAALNPDPKDPKDPQDPSAEGNCLENGTSTAIGANHGHNLTVSKEDVEAATEKTYTLSEASTDQHTHSVTLTASHFSSLKDNEQISVTSTSDSGHNHRVTVSCA